MSRKLTPLSQPPRSEREAEMAERRKKARRKRRREDFLIHAIFVLVILVVIGAIVLIVWGAWTLSHAVGLIAAGFAIMFMVYWALRIIAAS